MLKKIQITPLMYGACESLIGRFIESYKSPVFIRHFQNANVKPFIDPNAFALSEAMLLDMRGMLELCEAIGSKHTAKVSELLSSLKHICLEFYELSLQRTTDTNIQKTIRIYINSVNN